jgi:hypothetical protein
MEVGKLAFDLRDAHVLHERNVVDLKERIVQLQNSGRYRLGQAFDEARDLRGIVQLPAKVLRAVRTPDGIERTIQRLPG